MFPLTTFNVVLDLLILILAEFYEDYGLQSTFKMQNEFMW